MTDSDQTLLYGSIAAATTGVLVMVVLVAVLARRALQRHKQDATDTTRHQQTWRPEASKLMDKKTPWYSTDRMRLVPTQVSTSNVHGTYDSQTAHNSTEKYSPITPSPYKQTTVPFINMCSSFGHRASLTPRKRFGSPSSRSRSLTPKTFVGDCLQSETSAEDEDDKSRLAVLRKSSVSRWHSEEHLPQLRSVFESARSESLLNIADSDSLDSDIVDSGFQLVPMVELSMVWSSSNCSLSITLSKLINLPAKLKKCHMVATLKLKNNVYTSAGHCSSRSTLQTPPTSPIRAADTMSTFSQTSSQTPDPTTPFPNEDFSTHPASSPFQFSTDPMATATQFSRSTSPTSPTLDSHQSSRLRNSISSLSTWSLANSTGSSTPRHPKLKLKKSLDSNFLQVFTFNNIDFLEAKRSNISLDLKVKRRGPLGTKPFGEASCSIEESNLEPNQPVVIRVNIVTQTKNTVPLLSSLGRHRTPRKGTTLNSGALLLQVMYQETGVTTGRVKIVVLRGRSIVSPRRGGEYRVDVVVRQEGCITTHYKTNTVATIAAPVWNSPFLFYVKQAKVASVTLEASLIRIGRSRRSSRLGTVYIGLDTTETGNQQWHEVINRPDKEIAAWHPIVS